MENIQAHRHAQKVRSVAANAENMASLRKVSREQENCERPFHVRVLAELSAIATAFMLPKNQHLNASMCKYYGHIIDKKNWGKGSPNCQDCGAVIKSKDELRGSTAKA
ncbi:MAG: hypothetical protein K2W95_14100 [Candidatus Obscuribacterales bacterium]|nr:hypothetical protein [Candidatus Obscuribacterales bacterium]